MDKFVFNAAGIQGLYGGLTKAEGKSLSSNNMGSTELPANLFSATQTDEKLRRENIQGKSNANQTHFQVGAKVRQTIRELGGTMPENLPTPEKSIKQIEKQEKKRIEE